MKLLLYGESPCISTGLAQVSRTILDALVEDGHEIEVVAINHYLKEYDENRFPYTIHPCPLGDCTNEEIAVDRILNGDYDVFMYSSDFGRYGEIFKSLAKAREERFFFSIGYFPIDCETISPQTFDCLDLFNVQITYTEHGKRTIDKIRPGFNVSVIPLACEPDVFYPLSEEERRLARKELFDIENDDLFLCLSVNRNQPRKDLGRLLQIFHEFHKKHDNSMLYMHCKQEDVGGSVPTMAHAIGMKLIGEGTEIIFTRPDFCVTNGYKWDIMNLIYNAADCLLSVSTGEGWGLSTTEAMASGTPVIVPRNTAFMEIIGTKQERGYLVKSGGDIDHTTFSYALGCNNPRDIVHASSMLAKMERVYNNREEAMQKAILAREWTLMHTDKIIGERWKTLFKVLEVEQRSMQCQMSA